MPLSKDQLHHYILEALPDARIEITDLAGDDDHYGIKVTSQYFHGLTRVAQHKIIYNALQGNMGGNLHALQIQTSTTFNQKEQD